MALHEAGKLHCDLKPQNVLVEQGGRVVILDFGLVTEVGSALSSESLLVGTPEYMAPEQVRRHRLSPATDWYSIGVMLYQALTGRLPFDGHPHEILLEKLQHEAQPAAVWVSDLPEDLNDLCRDLLKSDPTLRPAGGDVIHRLGARPGARGVGPVRLLDSSLFGRERELATLWNVFQSSKAGLTTAIFVNGESGVGKTALVNHFLEEIRSREECTVLEGRCYERESVPFKSLDGLIDSLHQYLKRQSDSELNNILPPDTETLTQLFPTLWDLAMPGRRPKSRFAEPKEARLNAFRVLNELFARIAALRPLILFIDDLQWGDVDSAPVIADLLHARSIPLLLIVCYRSGGSETGGLVEQLLSREASGAIDIIKMSVGELDLEAAADMACHTTHQ